VSGGLERSGAMTERQGAGRKNNNGKGNAKHRARQSTGQRHGAEL